MMPDHYEASPIRRTRATRAQMEARYNELIDIVDTDGPMSVRQAYYRAVVRDLVPKTNAGYVKVQRAILDLRRTGEISYEMITDSTRWMQKPDTHGSLTEALEETARFYRRDLWRDGDHRLEVWAESDSIGSTVFDATNKWDVPLMVCRGFASETFAYNAGQSWMQDDRFPVVLYVGDHDPAGLRAEEVLRGFLTRFYGAGFSWARIAVTWDQVEDLHLPGTKPKKSYGYPIAVEAEAIPPRELRDLMEAEILTYVNEDRLEVLLAAEQSEREVLEEIVRVSAGAA